VEIKKILIRGVNWIGDAVLTIPAIKAIRKAFPDARISLLVRPWVAEIFEGNPDINEVILYEDRFNSITGKFKLAMILRAKGFDTAILLQNAFDAALLAWLSGVPERIGYSRDYRRMLLTKAVPVKTVPSSQFPVLSSKNKDIPKQHHVYYYMNLLKESLNIETKNIEPSIYLTEEEIQQAKNFFNSELGTQNSKLIVGINPGATYGSAKRWMPERFAELIHRIIGELDGRVVLFGSKSEVEIVREISSKFQVPSSKLLNMTGKTTLRELAALISECDAFITNDSGPMHIASALHVPIVAMFGSTDKRITGPIGEGHKVVSKDISCSPCLQRECPEGHLKCMTDITTEDVFNALLKVLPGYKAVFLDRDGTLIEDAGYLDSFNNLKIFEGTFENLQRLKKAGFKLIGVTNQSGVARGLISEGFVRESNAYLQKTLGIEDFYYCPHHPDERCQCRKPEPMLLRKASLRHKINLKASYVIGDKTLDMLLARAVGAKGVLVLTGHDRESKEADFIAKNLTEAVDWILERERN
jgi:heptosyltransferase-2